MSRPIDTVQDYSTTCLVMAFVNLMWFFGLIYALWGLPAVMLVAVVINMGIDRLGHHRAQGSSS